MFSRFEITTSTLSAAALLVLVLTAAASEADTIYVCWDGSADYLTIQEGIDAASGGDEVVVCDGVYTGPGNKNLDFGGKAITVRSANGPDDCIIDCEGDGRGFSFTSGETQASVVDGFTITNGYVTGAHGGGIYCWHAGATITNCTISGNTASWGAAGVMLYWDDMTISNCTISGNTAGWGGGVFASSYADVTITDCVISGNTVGDEGGGLFIEYANAAITNCTITDNTANGGAGIFLLYGADAVITNCTFSRNTAAIIGGGFYGEWETYATITNCIFWGDSPNELEAFGDGPHWVSYCDVQGGWPWGGPGNINANPLFVDPGNEDFHISVGSPCIDAANNYAVPSGVTTDLDGRPRFIDDPHTVDTGLGDPPIVDMGAYEFLILGDLNCDQVVDFSDINPFVLALSDPDAYAEAYPDCPFEYRDINNDGEFDFNDINPFVALLSGA